MKLNKEWVEQDCKCGLGDPHKSYCRSDMATITHDHGTNGNTLKQSLFCTNKYGEELPNKLLSPRKAMNQMDELYPISPSR